jgi:hypothetical protein
MNQKEIKKLIGKRIRIIKMYEAPTYARREGMVTEIDQHGRVFGTWGRKCLLPGLDKYEIIEEVQK